MPRAGDLRIDARATVTEARVARDVPAYLVCILLALAAMMFSGNSRLIKFPIGPDRVLYAVALVLVALDPFFKLRSHLKFRPLHLAMGAFVALVVESALAHNTLNTSLGFYALLDRVFVPFGAFILAPALFNSTPRRDLLLKTLVCVGFYLSLTAIFEVAGPHSLVLPRYIMDKHVGIQFGRARGPFLASEADGLVIAQCGFAAGFAFVHLSRSWRKFSALTCILTVAGVFLTLTRSVWIGSILGLIFVFVLSPNLRRWLVPAAVAIALGLTIFLVSVPSIREKASHRAETERSVDDRKNTDAAAVRIIYAKPLTGVGWERFIQEGPNYVRQAATYPITNVNIEAHNVILGRAAELGIPGAALWLLCVVGGPLQALVRRPLSREFAGWRLVALGGFCCWVVTIMLSPVPYPMPNLLVFFIPGLLAAPRAAPKVDPTF